MSNLYLDDGPKTDGHKVMLATTAYNYTSPGYVYSIQNARQALEKAGIASAYLLLVGNCHVDDARNVAVQNFLLSDCDDLIFLDADVSWPNDSLIRLCQADADLCGGVYPYRREGQNEKMPVIPMPDIRYPDESGLQEVLGLPTGFMKIRRHVLETLSKDADKFFNRAEPRSLVPIIFERTYDRGGRIGGDISFCRKWQNKGGKVYALPDLRLSHTGNATISDSMAAATRRMDHETLGFVVNRVKHNDYNPHLFQELLKAEGNPFSALEDILMLCAIMGRKAEGPIIETGSGLTSLILAASTKEPVYTIEHDHYWAERVSDMADAVNINNLCIVRTEIKHFWYDLPEGLPGHFSVGLNDGPPRTIGNRLGFFDYFGNTDNIIVDDVDDKPYQDWIKGWCEAHDRTFDNVLERSAIIRRAA